MLCTKISARFNQKHVWVTVVAVKVVSGTQQGTNTNKKHKATDNNRNMCLKSTNNVLHLEKCNSPGTTTHIFMHTSYSLKLSCLSIFSTHLTLLFKIRWFVEGTMGMGEWEKSANLDI